MNRPSVVFLVLTLLFAGCTAKPNALQTPALPTMSASASPSLTVAVSPKPAPVTLIAHMTKAFDAIAVYSVATGKERIVVKGNRISDPRFENGTTLTYVESTGEYENVQNRLKEIPIAGGKPKTLFSTPIGMTAYAWSPGRTAVAIAGYDATGYGFYVWNRGGKVELKRKFAQQLGRDGVELDDQHVEWSNDGERVLVVLTAAGAPDESSTPTMFVISKGKDVVAPRVATNGHWISNTEIVYEDFVSPYAWHVLDVETGKDRPITAVPASGRASVFRDQSVMVYDRGGEDITIHVYSFLDGSDRIIAKNGVGPIWLASGTVAYVNARRCVAADDCGPDRWIATGGTKRLEIGKSATSFGAISTIGVDTY